MIPKVYQLDIRKYGATRVLVSLAAGTKLYPFGHLSDIRYVASGDFTIPLEESPKLYTLLKQNYSDYLYTIDNNCSTYIAMVLERENRMYKYMTAEDAPSIPVPFGPVDTYAHQRAAIKCLEESKDDNILLAVDMGGGKTLISVAYAERNNYRTLFITKAGLRHNLDREIRKLTGKKVVMLSGRYPDASTMAAFMDKNNRYFIINYEVIGTEETNEDGVVTARPWADAINIMGKMNMLDLIVADEAHYCRNILAKRTRALLAMDQVKHRLPMTGTPLVNRIKELWPLLNWIAPKTFDSEQSFINTYDDGTGAAKNPKDLQKALVPYMFRRATKDFIKDLPPLIRTTQYVELNSLHKSRYNKALEDVYIALNGNQQDITCALAQLNRLRQIVADAKVEDTIEYIQNYLEDSDGKILIFSNWQDPAIRISNALKCKVIYQDVKQATRMSYCDDFNNNPDTRCLVITIGTGREGLNLTGATSVLFNDLAWTPADHSQAESRAYARLNDIHGINSIYMTIQDTVDDLQNAILQHKMQIFKSAIEGTKEYAESQNSVMAEFVAQLKGMKS